MAYLNSCLSALFIITFIVKEFVPLPLFTMLMTIVTVLLFCLNFQRLKPLNRKMVVLLMIGSGLLIWPGEKFDWGNAVIGNAGIITLLLTAPMLGIILHYAPYERVLLSLADRYIRTNYMFYVMILCLVGFLGILMNLAAVPFVNQLVTPLMVKFPSGVLYRALFRGYVVNLFWAPNMICVAVVLQYVNISWQDLAQAGIVFSALAFIAACAVGKCDVPITESCQCQVYDVDQASSVRCREGSGRYFALLIIQVVLILAVLTILTRYLGKSIYAGLAIVAIGMPLLFAIILKKVEVYRQRLSYYLSNTLPGMCNEFILFCSIGFFGYALAHSPTVIVVQEQLSSISNVSPGMLAILIVSILAGLSMVGIHPIITISSLAIAFSKVDIGLSSTQLAITLITGYVMYFFLSPFSSMVMLMSGLSGQSVYSIGLRMNARYAVVLSLMIVVSVYVWNVYA